METAFGTLKNHTSFAKLSIILSASIPVTTCRCRKALIKRNVKGLSTISKTRLTLTPANQYIFSAESYNQYLLCVRITTYPRAV